MTIIKMKPLAHACALVLATGSLTMGTAIAASALAGSTISNQITVTYKDTFGNSFSDESNVVDINIREVRAATLVNANEELAADLSAAAAYAQHTLTNTGNIEETYTLTTANLAGDSLDSANIIVWKDGNADGVLSQAELDLGALQTITLAPGESVALSLAIDLPNTAIASDSLHATLKAVDSQNNEQMTTTKVTFNDDSIVTTPIKTWAQANGGNCHAYTVIENGSAIGWSAAKAAAEALTYNGQQGHLLTMTSVQEQHFISSIINWRNHHYWMGLYQPNGGTTPFEWVTGEAVSFTNWHPGEPSNGASSENYAHIWAAKNALWNDINDGGNGLISRYVVEFDTACAMPKVEVALTAAKDVACDGTADEAFGDVNLADMAPGECAIMQGNVENTSGELATDVLLASALPAFTSFQSGSLAFCEGEACTLVPRTDNQGDDADYKANEHKVYYWFDTMEAGAKGQLQYGIKID